MNLLGNYPFAIKDINRREVLLTIANQQFELQFHELLRFRDTILSIDIEYHLCNDYTGIEILSIGNDERFVILDILQIIELQNLVKEYFYTSSVEELA